MSGKIVTDFTDFGNRKWIDRLPGGKADDKEPEDFDPNEIKIGNSIEREHTSNPDIATEIAMDHLTEDPEYYDKLLASGIADEKDAKKLYKKFKDKNDWTKSKKDLINNIENDDFMDKEFDDDFDEDEFIEKDDDFEEDELIFDDENEIENESIHIKRFKEL